jgi:general stress protein 26
MTGGLENKTEAESFNIKNMESITARDTQKKPQVQSFIRRKRKNNFLALNGTI